MRKRKGGQGGEGAFGVRPCLSCLIGAAGVRGEKGQAHARVWWGGGSSDSVLRGGGRGARLCGCVTDYVPCVQLCYRVQASDDTDVPVLLCVRACVCLMRC